MNERTLEEQPRRVQITADPWKSEVVVDGTDLSGALAGYTLSQEVGQPPTVVLYPSRRHTADFTGFAHVVVGDALDPGPAIAEFLRAVDPAALERAALNRDDLDGTRHELTRAMLAQLTDWALGKAAG